MLQHSMCDYMNNHRSYVIKVEFENEVTGGRRVWPLQPEDLDFG